MAPKYKGLVGTCATIASEEGVLSLFGGLSAGVQRQFLYSGTRIGLYEPVRDFITGPLAESEYPSLLQKMGAGAATGSFAIAVANPADLVKVKM